MNDELIKEFTETTTLDDLSPKCRELAELIGLENTVKLSKYLSSDELYVPSVENIFLIARNKRIREEFDGGNIKELTKKYSLTTKQVRNILNGKAK